MTTVVRARGAATLSPAQTVSERAGTTRPRGDTPWRVPSPLSSFRRVAVGGGAIAAGIAEAGNREDREVAVGDGGVACQRGRALRPRCGRDRRRCRSAPPRRQL